MAKNYYEVTLALAGICQSSWMVRQLAHHGQCNDDALNTSLRSLLDLNPPDTLAVYGSDEANLHTGLEALLTILGYTGQHSASADLTRYTLSIMMLERKLNASKPALNLLSQRISQLDRQITHFGLHSDTLMNAVAAIYVDIISPLGPRIQVTGTPAILQNAQLQSKIRATLLAGVRSAVLWRQLGGGRLQLMFFRNRLLQESRRILSRINPA